MRLLSQCLCDRYLHTTVSENDGSWPWHSLLDIRADRLISATACSWTSAKTHLVGDEVQKLRHCNPSAHALAVTIVQDIHN